MNSKKCAQFEKFLIGYGICIIITMIVLHFINPILLEKLVLFKRGSFAALVTLVVIKKVKKRSSKVLYSCLLLFIISLTIWGYLVD